MLSRVPAEVLQPGRGDFGGLMMKIGKLKKFDAAEHLRTPDARAEYLNIVLADGDPAEVRDALNLVARAQGMTAVAKAAGVTREGLYKTLGENGNPEFATVLRIIGAMGIRLTAEPARPGRRRRRWRDGKPILSKNALSGPQPRSITHRFTAW
jgi:probable addiction module antidote protein